jgi:hypothetical protein
MTSPLGIGLLTRRLLVPAAGALALTLALAALGLSAAAPPEAPAPPVPPPPSATPPAVEPITLTADHIEYNSETKMATADGHVRASRTGVVITADHLVANTDTQDVTAAGKVTLEESGTTATGTSLKYNLRTRVGRIEDVVTTYGPWHVEGASLETTEGKGTAYDSTLTSCDPTHPAYKVTAKRVVIVPNDTLTAYDASVYVAGVRVVTLPVYTASLKPVTKGQDGPRFGYDNLDGAWIDYTMSFPVGSLTDTLRLRYGTRTGITGENTLSQNIEDHVWSLHTGRTQVYDQNGTLFSLDRYTLDLSYDLHQIGTLPLWYGLEAHAGSYAEGSTGVSTTRGMGIFSITTEPIPLSPSLTWSTSGEVRFDTYGTGQQRTVLQGSTAVTDLVSRHEAVTVSYNGTSVTGTTPFAFDSIAPDSAISLSYTHFGDGLVAVYYGSITYSYVSLETSLGGGVTLNLSPSLVFSVSASYNLTTRQLTEIDYAVNARCDCIALGIVYRTLPQTPSQNQLFVTVSVTGLPESLKVQF